MTPLTQETIAHMAQLARLRLSPADIATYTEGITRILDMVQILSEVDTQGIQPMAHPLACIQKLRDDQVTEPSVCDTAMDLAPAHAAGFFVVPQVIE